MKTVENVNHALTYFAGADNTCGFAVEILTHETIDTHIKIAGACISAVKLAVHRQNGSHGKFGDGSGRVTRNTQNRDAESSCGIKIYVVKTSAAQKNKFDTERSQCLGNLFSYIVIYKNTDCIEATCEDNGVRHQ